MLVVVLQMALEVTTNFLFHLRLLVPLVCRAHSGRNIYRLVSVARNTADTCGFCLRYVCWGQCMVSYDFAFRAASITSVLLVMLEPILCDVIALHN